MDVSTFESNLSKVEFYKELLNQVNLILDGQRNWVTNLANVSSLIFHALNSMDFLKNKKINWTGFYVSDAKSDTLMLGPFQGKVACSLIKYGKGVCGTAAATRQTQDIHAFPGHIACDSGSNSEIVVPILSPDGQIVIGVLDIDCLSKGGFDKEDQVGLQYICEVIAKSCNW